MTKIKKSFKQLNNMILKRIMILTLGLFLALIPTAIKAQLFNKAELHSNTKIIKGKYYNGPGGRGLWTLDYVDSIGRVIKKERYYKKTLISRDELVYDNLNNIIFNISNFNNNSKKADTSKYEYKYAENRIIYQFQKNSDNDSTVIELTENQGDTLLKYKETAFHYRPMTKKTDAYETVYTLKYKNGLLISNEFFQKKDSSEYKVSYEYFEDGRQKRRLIHSIPKPKTGNGYCCGPGSDDEYYQYKLDSQGRVLKFYRIINGKRYKIAVYQYD